MDKSIAELKSALQEAKNTLTNAMLKVVMDYGEDFHDSYDYYRNEFGIDEEELEGNTKVLKIIDMFNNRGCCFSHAEIHYVNFSTIKRNYWHTSAFWGLYIVEEDKELYLKYYRLYNDGMKYDSEESEPDHYYVIALSLQELEKLSEYLLNYASQKI